MVTSRGGGATLAIASHEAVDLESGGQAMGRGPGQARGIHDLGEGSGAGLDGVEDGHRLVEDADPAYTVHSTRLSSQNVRWQTWVRR